MVEGEMDEVKRGYLEALKFAHVAIKKQCEAQLRLMESTGKSRNVNIT